MKRLRVLSLTYNLSFAGGQYRILALAQHIDKSRFDHVILSVKDEIVERYGTLRPQFVAAGAAVVDLHAPMTATRAGTRTLRRLSTGLVEFSREAIAIAKLIRELEIDVIDGHAIECHHAVIAGLLTGKPAVVTTYDAESFSPQVLYLAAQQFTLRAAKAVITDAQHTRRKLRRRVAGLRTPFYVIPNGTPPPAATCSREAILMRCDLPVNTSARIVATLARMIPWKGQRELLQAAKTVLERHPDTYFLIVGPATAGYGYVEELWALARSLKIEDRIRIFTYEGQIGDVWQIVDLHVHPSHYDSLPNAILEGMSLSKPQVVTSVGDAPVVVEHNVTGLVVPPRDSRALAAAIAALLDDWERAQNFGARAYQRYLGIAQPHLMTRAIESVFTTVAR